MKIFLSILFISNFVLAADDFMAVLQNSKNELTRLRKETSVLEDRVKQMESESTLPKTQLKKMEEQGAGIYGKLKAKRQEFMNAAEKHAQLQQQEDIGTLTRAQFLVSDFDMAIMDNRSVIERLHNLDRLYDQSNLGLYLKDKMLQFANTKQACEIAESCKDPKKRVTKANTINDVFQGAKTGSNDSTSAAGQR